MMASVLRGKGSQRIKTQRSCAWTKRGSRPPDRVIKEAITNAVVHRDYRMSRDIQIRIFDNRIEVESPGLFPGTITPSNIGKAGSFARNPLVARNLREFPEPPNVDAGEGVCMMFAEMRTANLFPPSFAEIRETAQPSVLVTLRNEERPPIWEQVSDWIDRHGPLANSDLCQIAEVDALKASKMLKRWVEQGVLLKDNSGGKRLTVYLKPSTAPSSLGWYDPLSAELAINHPARASGLDVRVEGSRRGRWYPLSHRAPTGTRG
ncbi:hypothetical protein G3480_01820 [Thiorhodococcus mannitoliphagus]|uniref:Uncharacterized protein n=1 Tax=Thiorhodococcus mannitoliphagus TaxID=329406 RepID=A0A6P1DNE1_9GAMM|nr:ATP-binding protein [Thiorhodococcus mannitoliphagus]NEX19060.1 hypothetical protein [Thiorhodococcus mannitoliphagus]